MNTPVLLLIYNRAATLHKVLDAIRIVQPSHLYVVADGPHPQKYDDVARCAAARALIDTIDWPCEIRKHYAASNMGNGHRVATGISWLFEQVGQAIILEDDCVPEPSFFTYCETLLQRYSGDPRIMMIAGTNPLDEWKEDQQSYHFSHYGMVWGWATWRRAWSHYDHAMSRWGDEQFRKQTRMRIGEARYQHCESLYAEIHTARKDTWDYQWAHARLVHQGLTVIAARNLVRNIGFGEDGTHTSQKVNISAHLTTHEMPFPLYPPEKVEVDTAYDEIYMQWRSGKPPAWVVARRAQRALEQGQWIYAYLWADAALRGSSTISEDDTLTLKRIRNKALEHRSISQ